MIKNSQPVKSYGFRFSLSRYIVMLAGIPIEAPGIHSDLRMLWRAGLLNQTYLACKYGMTVCLSR